MRLVSRALSCSARVQRLREMCQVRSCLATHATLASARTFTLIAEILGFNPTDSEMEAFIEPSSITLGELIGLGGLSQAV